MIIRVMLCIALFLQMFIAVGQDRIGEAFTLDQALSTALENNPALSSEKEKKQLASDVKSAWYTWLYRIVRLETQQEFYVTMSDLERIVTLRFKSGDLDFFEASTIMRKYADIQNACAVSLNEIDISNNTIRQLLYIDEEIIPADTLLILYEVDKSAMFSQKTDISMASAADSAFSRYKAFVDERIIENKQLELDNLFIRLQFYDRFGLNHAETIIQTAHAKYHSEEIDYIEFIDILSQAYSIRLDYLEILNDYNQHAIQLEYDIY